MSQPKSLSCVAPARASLGECPLWSTSEGVLYWIDIEGRVIHRFDPSTGKDEERATDTRPGSIGLTTSPGTLLLGSEQAIGFFEWRDGTVVPWFDLDSALPGVRLNDGRCDPVGRYWTGSMYERPSANRFEGSLYRIEADGTSTVARSQVGVSNGIAFSPEGTTMYFADTLRDTVWSYEYDTDSGTTSNQQVFLDFSDLPGRPDGACVDESGCYWVACVYGWSVARVSPGGRVDRIVELPVEKPTMPAFGGPDLSTLFVTSMGDQGSPESAVGRHQPGGLFAFEPGVSGMAEPVFGGSAPDSPSVTG